MLKNLEDVESSKNIGTEWVTERIIELDKLDNPNDQRNQQKGIFSDKSIALIE